MMLMQHDFLQKENLMNPQDEQISTPEEEVGDIQEAKFWQEKGWNAKVVKNEDDEGWAVEITQDGNPETVLVAPWTMGRDKKNPKPLDVNSFHTWIKTAKEVLGRHKQQLHATLNKSVSTEFEAQTVRFELAITTGEDPFGTLKAIDPYGSELGSARVPPNFKLTSASALSWAKEGFKNVGSDF